ncbi:phosphotransferase [Bacillus sp. FJAT-49705]|uniref:Phosphotransferase n=1 Tax=Cytobacillus citreus TaxID=2833586 RepID=A0ABS5NVR6_9BACI|nr:phosphotransferase [Cytobacillus citreus]MBS4191887.1 phosphotransferase [Cytobacillus citreus]
MKLISPEELVLEDLIKSCSCYFGFQVLETIPIKHGWLNLKWRLITDSGIFLLKQYNKERLRKYNHAELLFAFTQQMRLHRAGFPCPKLYSYNGQILLESNTGELFLLMEYCDGNMIPPGKLNSHQMYDLGRATGRMHQLLNDGSIVRKRTPVFSPSSKKERLTHWKLVKSHLRDKGKTHLLPIIDTQYKTTENINFVNDHIGESGWAHRDLWVDNILFHDRELSAVLDFDRMKYDFPQLDVARAVISGALYENKLDVFLVSVFVEGYREARLFDKGCLLESLKWLWYMESTWWIHAELDLQSGPSQRFSEEIQWLSENLTELEFMLKEL